MAEQSLLIRIGIDPSGAVTGGKIVEGSLGGVDNRLVGLNQRFGEGASYGDKLTHSLGRLGSAGRMDAFRMLSTDILVATTNMTGMGQASGLLRTGLFTLQSTLGAFLGPVGLAGIAIAGMAVVSMFGRKAEATKLAREELDKNLKSLNENRNALLDLAKAGDMEARKALIQKLTEAENKLASAREKAFQSAIDEGLTIVQADLKVKIGTAELENQVKSLKESLGELRDSDKVIGIITSGFGKNLEELWKNITASKEYRLELEKLNKVKIPEESLLKAPKGLEGVSKGIETFNEDVENSFDRLMEDVRNSYRVQKEETEKWKNEVRPYVSEVSSAFVDMMFGVNVRWGDMLENMVKQLLASGLQDLIMGLLFGGSTSILGSIFGGFLQSGTPYVQKSGLYHLEEGEAVLTRSQNVYRSSVFNQQSYGDNVTVNVFQLDAKRLTKKDIVPVIKEMIRNREINLT